ncbi:hypothetical protein [Desulforhopalus sp. 52FAK]
MKISVQLHIITMLLSCSLLFFFSTLSHAEDGYCSGVVVLSSAAEVEGTKNVPVNSVKLQNSRSDCGNWPQGAVTWFTLNQGNSNGMLATAISAQLIEYTVTIVTESGNSYSEGDVLTSISLDTP